MKQIAYISLLFIVIPFFVATFLLTNNEKKENENESKTELTSDVIVRVKRESSNKIEAVNLEEYVVGVVAGEMPIHFHVEALKAQAVAARSYVLKRTQYNKEKEYDVVDSVLNQVYLDNEYLKKSWKTNYDDNILKIKSAVLLTKGQYIEYDGKIADALYFSTSNGFTENSEEIFSFELPYLRSVESTWDEKVSPVFNDGKNYSLEELYKLLNIPYNEKLELDIKKRSSTGRILELMINRVGMTGSEFAAKLKIRSNHFDIVQNEKDVFIKTKGFGHGVGMSQYGAYGMAEEGYLYDEILKHYYQGISIGTL